MGDSKPKKLTKRELEVYEQLTNGEVVPPSPKTREVTKILRQKLGDDFVETRRGEGYILGTNESSWADKDRGTVHGNTESKG